MGSFAPCNATRLRAFFSRSNGRVVQLLMNTATSTLSAKSRTKRFTTAMSTPPRSSSCWARSAKLGRAM